MLIRGLFALIFLSIFVPVGAHAKKRLYLASPLGFSEATRLFKDTRLKPELARLGFDVIDPWVLTSEEVLNRVETLPYGPKRKAEWQRLDEQIAQRNRSEIDRADIMVAVLDGPDVDSGTASEIGYAFAMKKIIFGYRGDFRLDSDNEGATVNLQVEYFITASGGSIASDLRGLINSLHQLRANNTQ